MIGCKVAVLGTGPLAALLARSLPRVCRKWIVSPLRARAQVLADEVGAVSSDSPAAVRGATLVLLALPGADLGDVLQIVQPHLAPDALVLNCAVDVDTEDLKDRFPDLRIGAAHLLGDPVEARAGAPAVLLLDYLDEREIEQIRELLSAIGTVEVGLESSVRATFQFVRGAVGRLEAELRDGLNALGWEGAALESAIAGLAPGMLRSGVAPGREDGPAAGEAAEMRRWVEAALRN